MCLVLALVLGDASGVNVVYYVIAMLCFLELHASMVNLNVDFIGELIFTAQVFCIQTIYFLCGFIEIIKVFSAVTSVFCCFEERRHRVPWSSVIGWSLMVSHFFYSTGHQCTVPAIRSTSRPQLVSEICRNKTSCVYHSTYCM